MNIKNETMNRIENYKKLILENKGRALAAGTKQANEIKHGLVDDIADVIRNYRSLKKGDSVNAPVDITLSQFMHETYGFELSKNGMPEQFLNALGIVPSRHTIESLMSMPDLRDAGIWLVPELIVEAVRLGLQQNPMSALIAGRKTINTPTATVPHLNVSDTMPYIMGEGEKFRTGTISYGSKQVSTYKYGIGIEITDEVRKFTALDLLAIELQDVAGWLAIAKNAEVVNCLLNGDQVDNSYSAPVIGVTSAGTLSYKDLRRVINRMRNLQRTPQHILGSEETELNISLLTEVIGYAGGTTLLGLNSEKTDVRSLTTHSHGLIGDNLTMLIDPTSAIMELVALPLSVEEERSASHQKSMVYISSMVGYYKMRRDAAVLIDKSLPYSSNGFPAWMDIAALQRKTFRK